MITFHHGMLVHLQSSDAKQAVRTHASWLGPFDQRIRLLKRTQVIYLYYGFTVYGHGLTEDAPAVQG